MVWYNFGKLVILDAGHANAVDLTANTIKVALMKASYAINIDTHDFLDDITASEIVATNYTTGFAGGGTLGTKTTNQDNVNDRAEFDAADQLFSSLGNGANDTFDQVVIYKSITSNALSPLVGHGAVTSTLTDGGDVTLVWNAEGILHLTA